MSWRCLKEVLTTSLQDVLKTSSKRLEDVLKISWRFCKTSWSFFEKTIWHMTKANILVLIKRSRIQRWKMSLWCLQNFFITTNVCQVINDVLLNKNDSISTNVSSNQSFFGSLTLWLSVKHFYFLPHTFCFKLMSHIAIY